MISKINYIAYFRNFIFVIYFAILFNTFVYIGHGSALLDEGVAFFEHGRFDEAKTSFKTVLKNKGLSVTNKRHCQAFLKAMENNKTPKSHVKLHDHIKQQSISKNTPFKRFYKVTAAKNYLDINRSFPKKRFSVLKYLELASLKYPYAGYMLGKYLEGINIQKAQEIHFKAAINFEESKSRLLALRTREIKSYFQQKLLKSSQYSNQDLLSISSPYLEYDIACLFSLLLTNTSDSTLTKKYFNQLEEFAHLGSLEARWLCNIYKIINLIRSIRHSNNYTLSNVEKELLLQKLPEKDPIYLTSYIVYKLYLFGLISVSNSEMNLIKEKLKKLSQLDYYPAVYEYDYLTSKLGENVSVSKEKNVKMAINGNVFLQYKKSIHCLRKTQNNQPRQIKKAIYWLKKAARGGHFQACLFLGELYYEGILVEKDSSQSIYWLKKVSNKECPKAMYLLGKLYGEQNSNNYDWGKSYAYLLHAANNFYPPALNDLGELYLYGNQYLSKNYSLALAYFTKGYEWQYSPSIFNLAWMFQRGRGVMSNEGRATSIFRYGAMLDDSRAQHHLAQRLFWGIGVLINIEEALSWLQKAADNGYPKSCFQLAKIYFWGDWGQPQNISLCFHYFKTAAEMENSSAQYYLGKLYKLGYLGSPNYQKAAHWFLKAAKNSHIKASYEIGLSYLWGIGVKHNSSKAFFWINTSAQGSYSPAFHQLANLLFWGIGVEENMSKALEYYSKSINFGNIESCLMLAYICSCRKELFDHCLSYCQYAANNESTQGLLMLSLFHKFYSNPKVKDTYVQNTSNKRFLISDLNHQLYMEAVMSRYLLCQNQIFLRLFPSQKKLTRLQLKNKWLKAAKLICINIKR